MTSLPAHRVKLGLLPWVPDPKGGFPGLFERHGGNFQVPPTSCRSGSPLPLRLGADFCPCPLTPCPTHFLKAPPPSLSLSHAPPSRPRPCPQSAPTLALTHATHSWSRPQAWIAQDVSPPPKHEAIDPTDPAEVALVLEHHGKGAEPDLTAGFSGLPRQGSRWAVPPS